MWWWWPSCGAPPGNIHGIVMEYPADRDRLLLTHHCSSRFLFGITTSALCMCKPHYYRVWQVEPWKIQALFLRNWALGIMPKQQQIGQQVSLTKELRLHLFGERQISGMVTKTKGEDIHSLSFKRPVSKPAIFTAWRVRLLLDCRWYAWVYGLQRERLQVQYNKDFHIQRILSKIEKI